MGVLGGHEVESCRRQWRTVPTRLPGGLRDRSRRPVRDARQRISKRASGRTSSRDEMGQRSAGRRRRCGGGWPQLDGACRRGRARSRWSTRPATLQRRLWAGGVVILGVAIVLSGLATIVAVRTSRRLTEPLSGLAEQAERLGSGDLRPSGRHYGVARAGPARGLDGRRNAEGRRAPCRGAIPDARRLAPAEDSVDGAVVAARRAGRLARRPDRYGRRPHAAIEQVERLSAVVDGLLP